MLASEEKKSEGNVLTNSTSVQLTPGDHHNDLLQGRSDNADQLQRRLTNRQIQLLAIGGSIGTGLFVSIGGGLNKGGAGSLFLAFTIYSCVMALINNSVAEMLTLYPVSGGFIRLAGHFHDDALGFASGWNFFIYEALLIPFEITAICQVLTYWRDDIPVAAICSACIVLYGLINILTANGYGEAEFWLSSGKVILVLIVYAFTFVTMCGGNPQHDAYGFRNWTKPAAFREYLHTGDLGRFEGFVACFYLAGFLVVGPEYISSVAAEAKRPRHYIKNAFKTVYWRFGFFFIGGALCVGIVIAANDSTLVSILSGEQGGSGTGAASPYIIAMGNLGVTGLPHLVNALLVTSIFSAGNTYVFCGTRALYGLALEGRAPAFLQICTKKGVPIYCFIVTMLFSFLSFLQISSGTAVVLEWLINLITAGTVMNFIIMTITFLCYYRATQVQGLDRSSLPYFGWFQPYGAWIGLVVEVLVALTYGYPNFLPGGFTLSGFFSSYTLVATAPILYVVWKVIKRTKSVKPGEVDLVWERPIIDAYEASFISPPIGFWTEMMHLVGLRKHVVDTERVVEVERK